MSLRDFSETYCPHCYARIDFIQDYRPGECPFCKGIIEYDDCGGTIKGKLKNIGLQHVVLVLLVLVAIVFIAYVWGGR